MAIKGMDERFRLDLGGFFQKFDTIVRLDSGTGVPGTELSLENDLGGPTSQTSFRADGYWRFGRYGRVEFAYRGWNQKGSRVLSQDIRFGDQIYHVGASVDSEYKVQVGELYYSYSLVNTGEAEIGLMLGVSAYFNKVSIAASGTVTGPGGTTTVSVVNETRSLTAPIPAVGAHFSYTLLPGWIVYGKAKGLKATISTYTGSMLDVQGGMDFFFSKNFGIGGGYQYVKIFYEQTNDRAVSLHYRYSGPLAHVTLAF